MLFLLLALGRTYNKVTNTTGLTHGDHLMLQWAHEWHSMEGTMGTWHGKSNGHINEMKWNKMEGGSMLSY
jgi:hypothetical protein